ncbi:glycosyltransferase [Candidatus Woesearchaeota archaeon]|nr:glycosyltransferase [Candidatus Woesearchaeota archaeon]
MTACELSIVIPALNEEGNISNLLQALKPLVTHIRHEIIVVDGKSADNTCAEAKREGATIIVQQQPGFGAALKEGFAHASGTWILTMDADFSHEPQSVPVMWNHRHAADIIIGSRYVKGGRFVISTWRKLLSKFTNTVFSKALSIPVKDMSGNFRLYRREVLDAIPITEQHYNVLQHILVHAYAQGFTMQEIPIHYVMRDQGKSKLKVTKFARAYLRTLCELWNLRHSPASADYDDLAHDSWIPLQRYWQRKRVRIITDWINGRTLDIGCGSSRIIKNSPHAIACDTAVHKLRYLQRTNHKRVSATLTHLPFTDASVDTIVNSEVIEHVPPEHIIFTEMHRVLADKGTLIIGTPDYDKLAWRIIERIYDFVLPHAYADEHQTHYTKQSLFALLKKHNFTIVDYKYICNSELIVLCKKIPKKIPNSLAEARSFRNFR